MLDRREPRREVRARWGSAFLVTAGVGAMAF